MNMFLRLCAVFVPALIACASALAAPPEAVIAKLKRGVNLSHWWWLPSERDEAEIERAIGEDDVRLIKAAGLTHVRIPIDPTLFIREDNGLNSSNIDRFRRSIKRFTDAKIAVVIDAHPMGTTATRMLAKDNPKKWIDELDAFWRAFAAALKDTSPELVLIELLNEPNGLKDGDDWPAAQERLRKTVRAALPRHTIILTGEDWGSIDGLLKLAPAKDADTNVVYSIHFYEPHTFTHQGATWGSPAWKDIRDLKYPFDKANTEAAIVASPNDSAVKMLKWYAKEQWNPKAIRERFAKAKKWERYILEDGGVAVEDLTVADLNGDGKPDIVAVGRATGNARIYWNQGK